MYRLKIELKEEEEKAAEDIANITKGTVSNVI
jgi:hypothetical protein